MNKFTLLTMTFFLFWGCTSANFKYEFNTGGALLSDVEPEKGVLLLKNTHPNPIIKVQNASGQLLPHFSYSTDSLAILSPTSGSLDVISSKGEAMISVENIGELAFFSDSLALGIVSPQPAKYGIQTLRVILAQKDTLGNWKGFRPSSFRHYPYMDMGNGMGHSSNFNEPLKPMENRLGWYEGKVAYSMPGNWYLHFIVNETDTLSTQIMVSR